MGSNSSSHRRYASGDCVASLSEELRREWTQSFPRELAKQHSQPSGLKVLPEPPNQRLRSTNNGNIIHNGGTISGRRLSTLTLPYDLNKKGGAFLERDKERSRNTSATDFGLPRFSYSKEDPRHCLHRVGSGHGCRDNYELIPELKKFGSEPDLRCSPTSRHDPCRHQCYSERDTKERDSRYKVRQKYKAPEPPLSNGGELSPDSYCRKEAKYEGNVIINRRSGEEKSNGKELCPPPRRSRLFKTRVETRRVTSNWTSSYQEREIPSIQRMENNTGHDGEEVEEWRRENFSRGVLKSHDDKNILQRNLSSPEFQVELLQVAQKVCNKLNNGGQQREDPAGRVTSPYHEESQIISEVVDERRCRLMDKRRESRNLQKRSGGQSQSEVEICRSDRRTEILTTGSKMHSLEKKGSYRRLIEKQQRLFAEVERKKNNFEWEKKGVKTYRNDDPVEKITSAGRVKSNNFVRPAEEKKSLRRRGSGRESIPEIPMNESQREVDCENIRKQEFQQLEHLQACEDIIVRSAEVKELRGKERLCRRPAIGESVRKNYKRDVLLPIGKSPPRTFYFGMDESLGVQQRVCVAVDQQMDQVGAKLRCRNSNASAESLRGDEDEGRYRNEVDDIALKLRPTLPKKQLEIPRFSPSAAWRLLSALEPQRPVMDMAMEEVPVFCEERIERLSRPPPPPVILEPRSSHKSGDSGISGDAGAVNEDFLDVSTTNRTKLLVCPAWTPQQDLGEESSSDAGVDSPPPLMTLPLNKFPSRAHVFSLSLPREDHRISVYNPDIKSNRESTAYFNSLQKLKRSMSSALGLSFVDAQRKCIGDVLNDNWLLSTSAPNSLQHNHINVEETPGGDVPLSIWQSNFIIEDEGDDESNKHEKDDEEIADDKEEDEMVADADDKGDKNGFLTIMKSPSFSYLASGKHVMYLPESTSNEYLSQSLTYKNESDPQNVNELNSKVKQRESAVANSSKLLRERSFANVGLFGKLNERTNLSRSCENISEMKQRSSSPSLPSPADLQNAKQITFNSKPAIKHGSKGKRFTFQSTVRQIERRRLAERLSREAEAKENQRRGELEAMRKVEEEFQHKRAKEKANIRQQLRLFNMDENMSLPIIWDNSQLSRADPNGAPSSSASSRISAPPGKFIAMRKDSVSSNEFHHRKAAITMDADSHQQQQHREYKDYRPRYYDWGPESSSYGELKQTTIHPKVVYDIPKNSAVFLDANIIVGKPSSSVLIPRSDNYRKDFAHGAVAARSSLASSDSELSQPNTRPHSRQNGNKVKPLQFRNNGRTSRWQFEAKEKGHRECN